MVRWSRGQDAALSRRKRGFDSPTNCFKPRIIPGFFVCIQKRILHIEEYSAFLHLFPSTCMINSIKINEKHRQLLFSCFVQKGEKRIMNRNNWYDRLDRPEFLAAIEPLYGRKTQENLPRYRKLLDFYGETFPEDDPERDLCLFSAPGRTEIGGNHTDHQRGRVLAASVDMDMIAAAAATDDNRICILSEGFPMCEIDLAQLTPLENEINTTASLIRGMAAAFKNRGANVGGFHAVVMSSVLPGSGISSSAAFEVLVGNILNGLFFDGKADPVDIAVMGQYAENVFFGKPSGLMDQMASSVGNILTIDFEDKDHPQVRRLNADFKKYQLALCIIDSGADHADLTDEYAAIPAELKQVCAYFGKDVLREIPEEDFFASFREVRSQTGDRAVLRAVHFYQDNARVSRQCEALEGGDIDTFLSLVKESGKSSFTYLQNIVPAGSVRHQEMAVALAVCETLLKERGAFRVHGGGFAGTVQAFVPMDMLEAFQEGVDRLLGSGSCHVLQIRGIGGTQIRI